MVKLFTTPRTKYEAVRLPNGTYEVRRQWQSGMSWDVITTATSKVAADRLAYTYGAGQ